MSTNRTELCLITGGAGFIGANLANRLLAGGGRVRILDDLSRPGVDKNLDWLRRTHGDHLEVIVADVRDATSVREALAGVRHVYHLAAQVAVTTSLTDPLHDFDVNARGTLVAQAGRSGFREVVSIAWRDGEEIRANGKPRVTDMRVLPSLEWGRLDDVAWERAYAHYLQENPRYGDIQERAPLRLDELDRGRHG